MPLLKITLPAGVTLDQVVVDFVTDDELALTPPVTPTPDVTPAPPVPVDATPAPANP